MTPHDSGDSGRGPARQNPRQFLVTRDTVTGQRDSALSPGDRADKPSPRADESSYVAADQVGALQLGELREEPRIARGIAVQRPRERPRRGEPLVADRHQLHD